jgi:hypothetical protein
MIADDVKQLLEKDLIQHDISLSEGLHFLNGNILQYKKRAMFFTEGFAETKNRAEKLLADKDFESLTFIIHSLKSNAHALGALDQYCCPYGKTVQGQRLYRKCHAAFTIGMEPYKRRAFAVCLHIGQPIA